MFFPRLFKWSYVCTDLQVFYVSWNFLQVIPVYFLFENPGPRRKKKIIEKLEQFRFKASLENGGGRMSKLRKIKWSDILKSVFKLISLIIIKGLIFLTLKNKIIISGYSSGVSRSVKSWQIFIFILSKKNKEETKAVPTLLLQLKLICYLK